MLEDFVKSKDFIGHSGQIFSIDFDGQFIYSASADKFVTRWNISSGTQDNFAIKFDKSPYSLKLFNNLRMLAVGLENGDLHLFNLDLRKEVKFFRQHKSAVFSII